MYVARVLYMVCIVASSILWSAAKFVHEQEGNSSFASRKHYMEARPATSVGIRVDAGLSSTQGNCAMIHTQDDAKVLRRD